MIIINKKTIKKQHMNIIAEALGSYYHYKGISNRLAGKTSRAIELLRVATEKYEEALSSNPLNHSLLLNSALCWNRLNELTANSGGNPEDVKFNLKDTDIQRTDNLYVRCLASNPFDSFTLYSYAKFLWACGRKERAEELFLQSLEVNPTHSWCLRDYASFLVENNQTNDAERFYAISLSLTSA